MKEAMKRKTGMEQETALKQEATTKQETTAKHKTVAEQETAMNRETAGRREEAGSREVPEPRKRVVEEMHLQSAQRFFQGSHRKRACHTMEELCFCWLQERKEAVKKSTYSGYSYCVKMHILPYFSHTALEELKGDCVLAFIEDLQHRQLADSTVRSVLVVFKAVMKFGVLSDLICREILVYCTVNCRRTESRVLNVQDSMEMKEYLLELNTIFSIGILLCRGTGIRVGELCGLKWEDVDLSAKTICIRRTVSRIQNPDRTAGQPKTVLYIRTPKSHTSRREIPIPQYLLDPLKQMKKEPQQYLLTGNEICTEPRNIQKKFKTVLKHCKMEDCNFHAMRHGFATACLEKGIDCKTVSSILGHASTRTTMDFYVHTSLRQKQYCIDAVD